MNNSKKVTCPECGKILASLKGLANHVSSAKHDPQKIFLFFNPGQLVYCRHCPRKGSFISLGKGYSDLCSNPACIREARTIHSKLASPEEKQLKLKKIKATMLERYGVEFSAQDPELLRKAQLTKYEKAGGKEAFYTTVLAKMRKTNLARYGVEVASKCPQIIEKTKKTFQEKFNASSPSEVPEILEKRRATLLERYGVDNMSKIPGVSQKRRETVQERYGVSCIHELSSRRSPSEKKEGMERQYKTKKENKTFNVSKKEDKLFEIIKSSYPDVLRQFRTPDFPYNVDFYIPSLDLRVEYHGTWTHGKEPYVGNEDQKQIIKQWEDKNTKYYRIAIYVWTIADPEKVEVAREKNLKLLCVYPREEDKLLQLIRDFPNG